MTHWEDLSSFHEQLVNTAIITLVWQLSFFAIAYGCKFDKVTDFAYGTNFLVLALFTLIYRGEYSPRQIVLTVAVCIWALRLTYYLFGRILAIGHDKRFDNIRQKFFPFLLFWIFQFASVWLVHLPTTLVNSTRANPDLSARDYIGWTMFVIGLVIEAIADQQKFKFKQNPLTKSKWCDTGLWSWSRHPNYFGEMLLWWGVFTSAATVFEDNEYWVIIGPVWLTLALLFGSGIPPLERSYDTRYAQEPAYWHYKAQTSPVIPCPPALYRALPGFGKAVCCLECPCYTVDRKALAHHGQGAAASYGTSSSSLGDSTGTSASLSSSESESSSTGTESTPSSS